MQRYNENPIVTPADIPPSAEGFEIAGAFNLGTVVYKDQILGIIFHPGNKDVALSPTKINSKYVVFSNGMIKKMMRCGSITELQTNIAVWQLCSGKKQNRR